MKQAAADPPADRDDRAPQPSWDGRRWFSVVVIGTPIFLCMPRNFDVYHYDICSRDLLSGGVFYRDAFDNNLPGIVWLQSGIRWLIGWRSESLHAVDLLFFSLDVVLLLPWVRRGARVWTAAALYAFYLFIPEPVPLPSATSGCSCRRSWRLDFAAAASGAADKADDARPSPSSGPPFWKGLCWGTAFWIKPFVFIPGLACWLVGLLQVRKARPDEYGPPAADLLGLLAGGMLIGALGLLLLWQSGSWQYFWEILLVWNRDYGSRYSAA